MDFTPLGLWFAVWFRSTHAQLEVVLGVKLELDWIFAWDLFVNFLDIQGPRWVLFRKVEP